MDSVLFKSTGTVLFLPHPKRRNARPGSGFLLPLPQRISGDCRSQRLRQIHDFVPDRWLAHPGQRRHHVLWGKWSSARHRLHAAARSFYLNGETSGKMLRSDWKSPTRIQPGTWNAFAGCSPTTGFWNFSIKKPSQLSGGMRQRAALIRTMALEPDILLLDEPFSALDYQTRLTVSADIAAMIRKAEKSVILITHDLAEAISLADRVLILSARPARVKAEFPIHLTAADHSPLAARRAPEYGQLFNQIWEELSNENN